MEAFFLNKLTEEVKKIAHEFALEFVDVGFLTTSDKIWFMLQERPQLAQYFAVIWKKIDQDFQHEGQRYFAIPVIMSKRGIGLAVCCGNTNKVGVPQVRERLKYVAVLAEHFQHNQRIREVSQQKWGDPIVFVGFNSLIMERKQELRLMAKSDSPVLITGESGVGKEIFAKLCYLWSNRSDMSFHSVNCGQYQNKDLMVSELFGHKKGSFTGAVNDHKGVFEKADGGTVFLDEIGELSPEAQKMLLRVLGNGEITPLGSTEVVKVDVRVVSATHRNLKKMVKEGRFRHDLLYRLNNFRVHIPPLRERGDDVLLLLDYYLETHNEERGIQKRFTPEALDFLQNYAFPGNIRELKNIVETGFLMSRNDVIDLPDIASKLDDMGEWDDAPEVSLPDILAMQVKLLEKLTEQRTDTPNTQQPMEVSSEVPARVQEIYDRMTRDGADFWEAVKKPFMNRDLNRQEARAIVQLGLTETNGSVKKLGRLFHISEDEDKKFYDFLHRHDLQSIESAS